MYVCLYECMYICIYLYTYTGLEISGFALPNANQFQGKCESLPLNNSPYVLIVSQFDWLAIF